MSSDKSFASSQLRFCANATAKIGDSISELFLFGVFYKFYHIVTIFISITIARNILQRNHVDRNKKNNCLQNTLALFYQLRENRTIQDFTSKSQVKERIQRQEAAASTEFVNSPCVQSRQIMRENPIIII